MNSNSRVLILGGTGFVGRHVCEQLARSGMAMTVPTRRAVNAASVQSLPRLTVIEADVHDPVKLQQLMTGHDAVVKILLQSPYGAGLAQGKNKAGFNALEFAAWHGHPGVVGALLASLYAPELTQSSPDKQMNAMLAAAYIGHESVVNVLLESPYAAALLQRKDGINALMVAAQKGHEDVVRVLLSSDYGQALVEQRNKDGLNALMFAAFKNQAAVVCALLEFGFVEEQLAGIYCERSTIDNVIKKGFLTLAEVLIRYGAVATQSKAGDQSITPNDPD
jgi:ankyrin repeat protein